MKKILIINGHPNHESFNFAIANEYHKGVMDSGAQVETITIADLEFNPNLKFGYQKRRSSGLGSSRLVGRTSGNYKRIHRSVIFAWNGFSVPREFSLVG
jgi:putative NADPH-quinone reductase